MIQKKLLSLSSVITLIDSHATKYHLRIHALRGERNISEKLSIHQGKCAPLCSTPNKVEVKYLVLLYKY